MTRLFLRIVSIAFYFAFFSGVGASAQNQNKIDSLFYSLNKSKIGVKKVELLNDIASEYRYYNIDTAFYFATKALDLASKLGYEIGKADAQLGMGALCASSGKYNDGVNFCLGALISYNKLIVNAAPLLKKIILKKIGRAYTIIGHNRVEQGIYSEALKNSYLALRIAENLQDKKGIEDLEFNIGNIYFILQNYSKSLTHYSTSLKISIDLGNKADISNCYNAIGGNYAEQHKIAKAVEFYSNALKLAEEAKDNYALSEIYNNLGDMNYRLSNYNEALKFDFSALKIYKEIGLIEQIGLIYNNIALVYMQQKKFNEASGYLENALSILKKIKHWEYLKISYQNQARLDSLQKNYKKELEHYKQYIALRDKLYNKEITKKTVQTQMQYDFDKKESIAKAEQEKKDAITQKEFEKQKLVRNGFVGGLILVMLVALAIFRSLQQNKKAKAIISAQKEIVEKKNKEIIDSIEYAKRLQNAILPTSKLVKEYLVDSFIYYKPKDIVAGDFYWFYPTKNMANESIIFFAVADCTGHGVPGAMVSVVCANALNKAVKELNFREPGKILDAVSEFVESTFLQNSEELNENVKDGMDISLCALNLETLHLQWCGANNPLVIIPNNFNQQLNNSTLQELVELKPDKQPIGLYSNRKPFTTQDLQLKKGDMLYLFSDGYADQFGGKEGKKLMKKNLKNQFLRIASLPIDVQLTELAFHFEDWKGTNAQVDDVCVIGVRV